MSSITDRVRNELQKNAEEKVRISSQRFFKEEIKTFGVKAAVLHNLSKALYNDFDFKGKQELFEVCELLWQSGYIEEAAVACNWSYYIRKQYEPSDFETFERWILNYANNWATCDALCNHTVGTFIEMYPEFIQRLKDFTRSENRWMRRAAAVSLIVPARKGKFLTDIFEIADLLLTDTDDLVQKGYGWMLKVAANKHQQEVFEYVIKHKRIMPRTALRYAIEKMPADLKVEAMKK
ncbi:DNA alkylation repair protein [Maribellus mangrovi]|uniref:DNA alkylation repair protein n=1 Tax=Maribellus mangrovi TaxID=3133146 RepID=UPI0030EEA54E